MMFDIEAQPRWISGTPSVLPTGPFNISLNYGIDVEGTVYVIVFRGNQTSNLSSTYVRTQAIFRTNRDIIETATLSVSKINVNRILSAVLEVNDPDQVHTVYVVAANRKGSLQASPVRLTATTQPCPQANAGDGGDECDLNFIMGAVRVFGTGTWTRVSGPGSAIFSPGASNPDATVTVASYGTYVFRWTETQGSCTSFDEITVNFYRQPVSNAGSSASTCGRIYELSAADPSIGTGTWTMTSGSGTASFNPNANSSNTTVTVSEYGTKVFTWTVVNGPCSATSNVSVTFLEQPVANPGSGGNICGLEVTLGAVPSSGSGRWSRVSGPGHITFSPGPNMPNPEVIASTYGTYVLRWTETNGECSDRADITVSFLEQMSANAGNGGNECDRDFNLNAIPGTGTGTWTKLTGPGGASFFPDAHNPNARVTVTQYGDYDFAWTEVNNTCTSVDIIKVVFHAPPTVSAGDDRIICKGNSTQLMAQGNGSFLWSPSQFLNNPEINNPIATPQSSMVYTVTLTDNWGCQNSDWLNVEVRDIPSSYAGPDQVLDYSFESTLEANPLKQHESGEWAVLYGSGDFNEKNNHSTLVTNLSINSNIFTWSVRNGPCPVSTDTVEIIVKELLIPSLITPNMDGKNDFFILKGIQSMGKTSLTVFNRWGVIIYSNEEYSNEWDGVDMDGNPLPADTYYYILKPERNNAINGFIVIRR
ncbi:MAG: gliding motility-associated C-terminal domain-containing protein [Bacteroidales bacterium]|nr:gliding motility-associated C-terminal domain-containing protein [Bacteroidales bacterium]